MGVFVCAEQGHETAWNTFVLILHGSVSLFYSPRKNLQTKLKGRSWKLCLEPAAHLTCQEVERLIRGAEANTSICLRSAQSHQTTLTKTIILPWRTGESLEDCCLTQLVCLWLWRFDVLIHPNKSSQSSRSDLFERRDHGDYVETLQPAAFSCHFVSCAVSITSTDFDLMSNVKQWTGSFYLHFSVSFSAQPGPFLPIFTPTCRPMAGFERLRLLSICHKNLFFFARGYFDASSAGLAHQTANTLITGCCTTFSPLKNVNDTLHKITKRGDTWSSWVWVPRQDLSVCRLHVLPRACVGFSSGTPAGKPKTEPSAAGSWSLNS